MIYTQQFFVGSKYYGSSTILCPPIREHGYSIPPTAYAYFCPDCGAIWARRVIADHHGTQEPFFALVAHCEKHATRGMPGSLQHPLEPNQLKLWPEEMIRYEFAQAMKYYEKEEEWKAQQL